MSKPTEREWEQLANLNQHNAAELAAIKADKAAGRTVKKGRVLRARKSCEEAVRLERSLKKRAGIV
jgi:hypothetical protein